MKCLNAKIHNNHPCIYLSFFFFFFSFFWGGGIFCDTPSVVDLRLETLNRLEIPTGYSEDVTLRADNAMSKRKTDNMTN